MLFRLESFVYGDVTPTVTNLSRRRNFHCSVKWHSHLLDLILLGNGECNCLTAEKYIEKYNDWCKEFENYQRAYNEWEILRDQVIISNDLILQS